MEAKMNLPVMMTVQDVAQRLNVGYNTALRWVQEGEINAVKVGKKIWRIPRESFLEFVEVE